MSVVELQLPALPAHVRTARIVGVAAARRAGLPDSLLDEFRLAMGEACARAVRLNAQHAPDERVTVTITDDVHGLTGEVHDCGPAAGPAVEDLAGELLDGPEDDADPDVALGLLAGLVDEVDVTAGGSSGTTVRLRWPLPARMSGGPRASQLSPS